MDFPAIVLSFDSQVEAAQEMIARVLETVSAHHLDRPHVAGAFRSDA